MLPLVLALLPLTTNTYSSGDPDLQWCLIVPRSGYPSAMALFWAYASFFVWLFVCILLMIYWGVMIQWRYWGSIASQIVRRTYEKVWLYPVALSLCWLLNVACVFVPSNNQTPIFYGMSTIFGLSNGIVNTTIFILYNGEITQRWMDYFQGKKDSSSTVISIRDTNATPSPSEVNRCRDTNASDVIFRQSDSINRGSDTGSFESISGPLSSQQETGDLIGGDWFHRDTDLIRAPNSFTMSILFTVAKRDSTASTSAVNERNNVDTSANDSVVEMT